MYVNSGLLHLLVAMQLLNKVHSSHLCVMVSYDTIILSIIELSFLLTT